MRLPAALTALLLTACSTPDTGWRQAGPGGFTGENGILTSSGGMGLYWYSAASYNDYTLTLDWRRDLSTDQAGQSHPAVK